MFARILLDKENRNTAPCTPALPLLLQRKQRPIAGDSLSYSTRGVRAKCAIVRLDRNVNGTQWSIDFFEAKAKFWHVPPETDERPNVWGSSVRSRNQRCASTLQKGLRGTNSRITETNVEGQHRLASFPRTPPLLSDNPGIPKTLWGTRRLGGGRVSVVSRRPEPRKRSICS